MYEKMAKYRDRDYKKDIKSAETIIEEKCIEELFNQIDDMNTFLSSRRTNRM
jgi:hypothetical protein